MTGKKRWLGVVVAISAVACALKPPPNRAPVVSAGEVSNATAGDSSFAFRLYSALAARQGNLVFSPATLRMGLSMVWAGAKGETAEELGSVLKLGGDPVALHKSNETLIRVWTSGGIGTRREPFALRMANGCFVQLEHQLQPEFSVLLTQRYGAPSAPADFFGAPETARNSINRWVEKKTDGRIPEALESGSIETGMQMVLVSAVYARGSWLDAFDPERTRAGSFQLSPKKKAKVDMMTRTGSYAYADASDAQVLEIPYAGDGFVMDLLLPKGELAPFEQAINADKLEQLLEKLQNTELEVSVPRFQASTRLELKDTLMKLGVAAAFDPAKADFSGVDGTHKISLAAVVHQALLKIDEQAGDNPPPAAPAADAGAPATNRPAFRADHPFMYLIRDRKRNAILFLGRLTDPRGA